MNKPSTAIFNITVLVAALGYFVDIYDLLLFNIVRVDSLKDLGLGSTMIYSPNFNFGVELTGRYTFSDNLDGYTSQYSSSNDVYYFFNFTITYKMKNGAKGWPSFR